MTSWWDISVCLGFEEGKIPKLSSQCLSTSVSASVCACVRVCMRACVCQSLEHLILLPPVQTQGFVHVRQVLYQLNYIPTLKLSLKKQIRHLQVREARVQCR